jgi:diguanylate cyclase (GGDEF)-like protein
MLKILSHMKKSLKNLLETFGITTNAKLIKELELYKQTEKKLLKQNHFLQHILATSTTQVWHFDKELRLVFLNKTAKENLSRPLEAYIGKTYVEYSIYKKDAQFYYELDKQVIISGQPELERLDTFEAQDGTIYYKKIDRIPYYDENGDIAGLSVHAYDISEQKWAENSLREQKVLLENEINKRIAAEDELRRFATTDSLTGLYNRRHFLELADKELIRSRRTTKAFSIIMFDIDHFKCINDTYGHQAGDQVLKTIALACQENLRQMDVIARYGGDEFIILLPEVDSPDAHHVANKIRTSVAEQEIMFENQPIIMTISLGVATLSMDTESLDQIFARVDKALYRAKEAGRNQVKIG